ncbi:serine/threonine-protein kinase [Leifsonia sp. NCR5]|uniref:serine/threonine-protein kinase n=1 Tax=Leifsonia sp. NCR5 TaxID=1978342 RepID=UPI000A19B051|nr:serine/threonine-protein kinase [Leifsonia sp. NCR5]
MRRLASQPPALPGFHFIRLLGSGGFSDVFLYEQELPKRSVAVKVLLTDSVDDAARARFVAEANVMAQLSAHPYIVTIHHADVSADERPYLVMEYCSGPSLGDRFKRERFTVEDALRTGVRLSSAIATAHSVGILHRDIKPANVLTTDFGWPALTDFGIASALEELPVHTASLGSLRGGDADTGTSGSRSVGLSVPWSPAEMFDDDPQPDVRSDVFSLAATIHTILAGRTPFEVPGRANGTLDLIGRIERGMITPIDRDDLPPSLVAVLRKGMATKRDDRFATAVDFARALQRVELELGFAPTSIDVPNLRVLDESPPASGEDETRARSVQTVDAQGLRPATRPSPSPTANERTETRPGLVEVPPELLAGPTVVRGAMPTVHPEQQSESAPVEHTMLRPRGAAATASGEAEGTDTDAPDAEHEPRASRPGTSRPRWLLPVIAAAAVLVVAGGVLAAVLVPSLSPAASPTQRAGTDQDGTIAVTVVPPPTLVSATRDASGTTATIVWKTAKPEKGDQYQWVREGTTDPPTVTAAPKAQLTGLTAGVPVCIDVATVRSGRTSEPLKACAK